MTDVDERLFTAAKLYEQVAGDLDGDPRLLDHAGLPVEDEHLSTLSFLHGADAEYSDTGLAEIVDSTFRTRAATRAVEGGDAEALSYLVGVTEQDLDGSALRLPMLLLDQLENNDAPAFVVGAGNPNTGKTNTMSLLAELRAHDLDDLLVLSNVRSWELTDRVVTSAHDLAVALIEERDRPKFVLIDEASTHFDARTYRHEVATQWTPLAKRFAKLGVDVCGVICHTGKDLHPEAKRLCTLAYYKEEKDVAEFYDRWPADADKPVGRRFGGSIEELEQTRVFYDPDDAAPWMWDLDPNLFTLDLNWSSLLDRLRGDSSRCPSE